MFTEAEIKAAHSKVLSGADFPAYIRDIKELGVNNYETFVIDGHAVFHGANGYEIVTASKYVNLKVADSSDPEALRDIIKIHQAGQTDYPTFCTQVAAIGVEKWVVDTHRLMCTYYDLAGNEMVAEPIPEISY
ncbi:MAG: DUF1398 domain-containing protein [Pedobacter sp.]|nr:MAG: DUF1398 domain-containing protein [Pedobacter sp.]